MESTNYLALKATHTWEEIRANAKLLAEAQKQFDDATAAGNIVEFFDSNRVAIGPKGTRPY